jgi:hypothetical protein
MEKRSRRRTRDLVTQPASQGLSQNENGCARMSMMAKSMNAPFTGRIQKRKTNPLHHSRLTCNTRPVHTTTSVVDLAGRFMSASPPKTTLFHRGSETTQRATVDIANCYICAFWGRNLMTAIRVIRMKTNSTAAWMTAKGGSVCVGANALSAETFTKLCTTKTKTLR